MSSKIAFQRTHTKRYAYFTFCLFKNADKLPEIIWLPPI